MVKWSKKNLLMCLAGILLILAVNLLAGQLDIFKGKMRANQIISPWDTSSAPPPLMQPSRVVTKPLQTTPVQQGHIRTAQIEK